MVARKEVIVAVAAAALVGASACACSFVYEVVAAPEWQVQELLGVSSGDGFYQLAWNSRGELQLAYIGVWSGHYALIHGEKLGKDWNFTFLARLTYWYERVSMVLDSEDNIYICTHCDDAAIESQIVFATRAAGEWDVQGINTTTHYCKSAEVVLDSDDQVHILYSQSFGEFYAESDSTILDMVWTPEGWNSTVLATVHGESHFIIDDIERRNDGSFGLIYTNIVNGSYIGDHLTTMSYLNYTTYSGGRFADPTTLFYREEHVGDVSLRHDSEGNAYVVTYKVSVNSTYRVCLYSNAEGNWTCTDIAYGGVDYRWPTANCLTVQPDRILYVGYFVDCWDGEVYNHTARYCTNADGTWQVHLIDDDGGNGPAEFIALVLDDESDVHIVYSKHGATIYTTDEPDPDKYTSAAYISGVRGVLAAVVVIVAAVLLLLVIRFRRIVKKKRRIREAWIAETDAYAGRGRQGEL